MARGKTARMVLSRYGRPVAGLVPYEQSLPDLWGALRGSVTVPVVPTRRLAPTKCGWRMPEPAPPAILFETHAVIWLANGDPRR